MSYQSEHEDEDVIFEVPVYMCKLLAKQLYVVEFPQRPATIGVQKSDILEVKMKEGVDKLQMTLALQTDSDYYDEIHGEHLAEAAEGLGLDDDEYIPDTRKKIDKTVLQSNYAPKPSSLSRYVIGVIKDGAVHFTPLKSVVQLKPTLSFHNKAEKAKAKHESGKEVEEIEEEATKVTIKFKRAPFDPNKPTTNKSSFIARKKEEEEPWTKLEYEDFNKNVHDSLCYLTVDDEPFILSKTDFKKQLFSKHVDSVIDGSDKISKSPVAQRKPVKQPIKVTEQLQIIHDISDSESS